MLAAVAEPPLEPMVVVPAAMLVDIAARDVITLLSGPRRMSELDVVAAVFLEADVIKVPVPLRGARVSGKAVGTALFG